MADQTFTGLANLIKHLPTGTMFLFQFLNPTLSNNGSCSTANQILHGLLVAVCGFSCAFSCFTDSYVDKDGKTQYGLVTKKGLWPCRDTIDLSSYKLRMGDFVHAAFSLLVFGVVVLLNPNTIKCYYPSFEDTQKTLLMVLPPVIGTMAGTLFVVFPNKRHGIGYAITQSAQATGEVQAENDEVKSEDAAQKNV